MNVKRLATANRENRQDETSPDTHPFTIPQLRLYAYAKKFGEPVSLSLAEHLASCAKCEDWLKILHRTDPVLNGEDEARVRQLIRNAEITTPVPSALAATAIGVGSVDRDMKVFAQLFGTAVKRGADNDLLETAEKNAEEDEELSA
jgi:hypothetical protein